MNPPYVVNQSRQKPSAMQKLKPYVEVKLVTWNKDSHGLFDYESKSVDLKFIRVETPCEVYRLRKENTAEGSSKEKEEFRILDKQSEDSSVDKLNSNNSIFLVSIENQDASGKEVAGKFYLNVFRDSLNSLKDNPLAQDPYLIVRSLKNENNVQKGYDLKIGDIVKFGRIEYQVVQLRNAQSEAQTKNIEKHIFHQSETIVPEGTLRTCKICLGEDDYDGNFFCNPCECKGSCEYVHIECLKNWIQSKLKCKTSNSTSVYSWKKSDCELCKAAFPKHINYKNTLYDLLDLQVPKEEPYIVLESIAKEKKVIKTLFIFTATGEDQEIKLGRGHQCEVRISDISVSRTHSFIKFQKGKFSIYDNTSKFGTLIKMNNDLEINTEKKAVQIGRTVITFALKSGQPQGINAFQEKTDYAQKPIVATQAQQAPALNVAPGNFAYNNYQYQAGEANLFGNQMPHGGMQNRLLHPQQNQYLQMIPQNQQNYQQLHDDHPNFQYLQLQDPLSQQRKDNNSNNNNLPNKKQ